MHVIGIAENGTLLASNPTLRILNGVKNPRVTSLVVSDPDEVKIVQSCLKTDVSTFLLLNEEGLAELRQRNAEIRTLGQIDASLILNRYRTPRGIGGWLLIFCLLLIIILPATMAYQTIEVSRLGFWKQTTIGTLYYFGYVGLALFGITAGVFLLRRKRNAVTIAKLYLGTTALYTMSLYLWIVLRTWSAQTLESIEMSGRDILLRPIVFVAIWALYLARSKRVRNTFHASSRYF
ncbi:MAG TPA: DUF2569 family protein [Candidatus Sulfotelmatobacter sp.]